MSDVASIIAITRLREVVLRLSELEDRGADLRWFIEVVAQYESGAPRGARLDEILGLIPGPGQRAWWTTEAKQRRGELLRNLALRFYADHRSPAAEIAAALLRYQAAGWLVDRPYLDPPRSSLGTVRELLFRLLKCGSPPGRRTIEIALAERNESPLFLALQLPQLLVMLGTNHRPRLRDPETLEIEPIGNDPAYQAELATLADLEARLRATEARRAQARLRERGKPSQRSLSERAQDLLAGGRIPAGYSLAAELQACDQEEFEILRPAIATQSEKISAMRGELSFAASEKLRRHHEAALVAALHAIADFRSSCEAVAGISARLRSAGYEPSGVALPQLLPHLMWAWCRRDVGGSPAWFYEKALREHGVIS